MFHRYFWRVNCTCAASVQSSTIMELTNDVSAERVHFHKEQKILNDIAQEARDQASGFATLSEEALFEKVEAILLEKIKSGDSQAYFQLGLLFFEQVSYI